MNVSLLQMDIDWASPSENIRRAEELISTADSNTDLYVLPEMWATGFAMEPEGIAEEEASSEALGWMRQTARQRSCAVSGSLAVKVADGTFRNRHYFVTPDATFHYDKHHLFSHGHENKHYTCGDRPVIVSWQGVRILLLTCYDLRFPVFSRYGRAGEYDVILCVANWPAKRQQAWHVLTRARAIENQCYLVAVNRVGNDPACAYSGGSLVADPKGDAITLADSQRTLSIDLNMERLQAMRHSFRVLDDRDV